MRERDLRDPFRHQIKVGVENFIKLCVWVFGYVFVSVSEAPFCMFVCGGALLDLKPL